MNHPMFLEWVKESVGALKGQEKVRGKCALCCMKKKRLMAHEWPSSETGTAMVCLPCNRVLESICKINVDGMSEDERAILVHSRVKSLNRIRLLYHALLHNHPPELIAGLLRSINKWILTDQSVLMAVRNRKQNDREYPDEPAF